MAAIGPFLGTGKRQADFLVSVVFGCCRLLGTRRAFSCSCVLYWQRSFQILLPEYAHSVEETLLSNLEELLSFVELQCHQVRSISHSVEPLLV